VSGKNAKVSVTLACSAADFPVSSIQYDLYCGSSPQTLALVQSSTTPAFTHVPFLDTNFNASKPLPQFYYQVRATFVPTGWSGGSTQSVVSNILGPTPTAPGVASLAVQW